MTNSSRPLVTEQLLAQLNLLLRRFKIADSTGVKTDGQANADARACPASILAARSLGSR